MRTPGPHTESLHNLAVGFSAPIYGARGDFRGVVATRVPVENLRTIFEQEGRLRYGEGTYDWVLLTRDGKIISEQHQRQMMDDLPMKIEVPSLLRAAAAPTQPGFVEEVHERRGTSIVTGYARTQGYKDFRGLDWIVLFRLNHDQVYAPVDRLLWTVGGIALLVILPLTGYSIWISWRLGRERNDLIRAQQNLEALRGGTGPFQCRPPTIRVCGVTRFAGTSPHGEQLYAAFGEALQGKAGS